MYWQKRFDRPSKDSVLEGKILAIRAKNKDFGYRRIYGELHTQGVAVNKKRVQRIVQKLNLQVTSFTRKSRKYSSYKGTVGTVAPNRLHRRFETSIPHQKITTDTTEFKYYEKDNKGNLVVKKAYLDPYLDLFNREILSYSITQRPSGAGIQRALKEAIRITADCPFRRTFHSDQGWAYQMKDYVKTLKKEHIFQSMSRKGNCLDNSVMENFFGLLKQEMYYGHVYHSFEELKQAIEGYITYYNTQRIKQKLGWLSPMAYRLQYNVDRVGGRQWPADLSHHRAYRSVHGGSLVFTDLLIIARQGDIPLPGYFFVCQDGVQHECRSPWSFPAVG